VLDDRGLRHLSILGTGPDGSGLLGQSVTMAAQVFTDSERPDLAERLEEFGDPWPEFIHHDEAVMRWWPLLHERFPDFQVILHDPETNVVLGRGCTIPVSWDGRLDTLSGGVVDALVEGFSDGAKPNVLCALVAVVDPDQQGRGLSGHIIHGMAETAGRVGLECLIAPVRPTWKERYPLVPLEEYMHWTRDDGLPFDPWIRLHERLGADILAVAPRSLDISGSVTDWEAWTGLSFPEDGEYVVPGALVPVRFEGGTGHYVEPNVWMRHEVRRVGESETA
jgi:GNAT superfamily N-acetyltransferase